MSVRSAHTAFRSCGEPQAHPPGSPHGPAVDQSVTTVTEALAAQLDELWSAGQRSLHNELLILAIATGTVRDAGPDRRVRSHEAPIQSSENSMRASHNPGASTSAGVGSSRSLDQSRARPSSPARSTTPSTNAAPRS